MRVLLSTYDSRGGVEPLAALAVRSQELGAEALVCAPPDCAERLAEVGVPLVPVGEPVRTLVHGATPPSPDDVPRLTAELIATWFDKVAAADPVLAPWPEPAYLDVVQTGAWILPDERPLPAELEAFLDVGPPPVYVGFGSMRAPADVARVAIEAIRTQGGRVLIARGWADL